MNVNQLIDQVQSSFPDHIFESVCEANKLYITWTLDVDSKATKKEIQKIVDTAFNSQYLVNQTNVITQVLLQPDYTKQRYAKAAEATLKNFPDTYIPGYLSPDAAKFIYKDESGYCYEASARFHYLLDNETFNDNKGVVGPTPIKEIAPIVETTTEDVQEDNKILKFNNPKQSLKDIKKSVTNKLNNLGVSKYVFVKLVVRYLYETLGTGKSLDLRAKEPWVLADIAINDAFDVPKMFKHN